MAAKKPFPGAKPFPKKGAKPGSKKAAPPKKGK